MEKMMSYDKYVECFLKKAKTRIYKPSKKGIL